MLGWEVLDALLGSAQLGGAWYLVGKCSVGRWLVLGWEVLSGEVLGAWLRAVVFMHTPRLALPVASLGVSSSLALSFLLKCLKSFLILPLSSSPGSCWDHTPAPEAELTLVLVPWAGYLRPQPLPHISRRPSDVSDAWWSKVVVLSVPLTRSNDGENAGLWSQLRLWCGRG